MKGCCVWKCHSYDTTIQGACILCSEGAEQCEHILSGTIVEESKLSKWWDLAFCHSNWAALWRRHHEEEVDGWLTKSCCNCCISSSGNKQKINVSASQQRNHIASRICLMLTHFLTFNDSKCYLTKRQRLLQLLPQSPDCQWQQFWLKNNNYNRYIDNR